MNSIIFDTKSLTPSNVICNKRNSIQYITKVIFSKLFFISFASSLVYASTPLCYKEAYPEYIISADEHFISFQNGTKLPYTTTITKSTWLEKLNNADLKMQLSQNYPKNKISTSPTYLFDPGRLRYQPFFSEMYGKNKPAIETNLVKIDWQTSTGIKKILVSKINNIDQKLIQISKEIANLPVHIKQWADNPATYYYRTIKDTNRLSMHSYGIAIDLSPSKTEYWKNEATDELVNLDYHNSMPLEIVSIFEKYGFIWGGRWYHYDTMHFEYRPELLAPSCQ